MVKFKTRFIAFIIDIVILSLVISLVQLIIPKSTNYKNLENELEEVQNQVVEEEITIDTYLNRTIDISYQMAK